MSETPVDGHDPYRSPTGRFLPGNPGGPGRPRGKTSALRRAIEDAVTPEQLAALTRRVLRAALEGDLQAARLLYERACGRPSEAPSQSEPLGLAVPKLDTAGDCNAALGRLAEAVCAGTVDREAAKMLIDVIQTRLKAIEVGELEKRLAELEGIADSVEHRGPRRLRR